MTGHLADQLPESNLIAADDFLEGTGRSGTLCSYWPTGRRTNRARTCPRRDAMAIARDAAGHAVYL